ncbi:MAG: hypothetical protein B6U78_01430 [Candidatus Aenigmarchaeota archaeon ex4484_224]|nr:MAG: hypothetical protein B6U78_01430 [Candidatus Aenigmarchaeota archaeon ex4484_224]
MNYTYESENAIKKLSELSTEMNNLFYSKKVSAKDLHLHLNQNSEYNYQIEKLPILDQDKNKLTRILESFPKSIARIILGFISLNIQNSLVEISTFLNYLKNLDMNEISNLYNSPDGLKKVSIKIFNDFKEYKK